MLYLINETFYNKNTKEIIDILKSIKGKEVVLCQVR